MTLKSGLEVTQVIETGAIRMLEFGFLFAFHSNYGHIFLAISQILSIKEWPDLEIWVWVRSRSFKMARFDRSCMIFYLFAIVTVALSSAVFDLFDVE